MWVEDIGDSTAVCFFLMGGIDCSDGCGIALRVDSIYRLFIDKTVVLVHGYFLLGRRWVKWSRAHITVLRKVPGHRLEYRGVI